MIPADPFLYFSEDVVDFFFGDLSEERKCKAPFVQDVFCHGKLGTLEPYPFGLISVLRYQTIPRVIHNGFSLAMYVPTWLTSCPSSDIDDL